MRIRFDAKWMIICGLPNLDDLELQPQSFGEGDQAGFTGAGTGRHASVGPSSQFDEICDELRHPNRMITTKVEAVQGIGREDSTYFRAGKLW